MPEEKSYRDVWALDPSGLLVRDGSHMTLQVMSDGETFLHLKTEAIALRDMFTKEGIPLAPNSDLGILVAKAIDLSDRWMTALLPGDDPTPLFHAHYLDRVVKAALPLRNVPGRRTYLKDLASGSLHPFLRIQSKARDTLWELELWSILKRMSFDAQLLEPDVRVSTKSGSIGLACKKVYVEKNFSKVLSQGVKQIGNHGRIGIIAVNLDDLVPASAVVIAPDITNYNAALGNLNLGFMHRNEGVLRKYLSTGRAVAALVSTSIPGRIPHADGAVVSSRQTTIWSLPTLAEPLHQHVAEFRDVLFDGRG